MDDVTAGARGFTLVELLVAVASFGLGAAAIGGLAWNVVTQGRQAAVEGRRAALALSVADGVRAGLLTADSGVVRASIDGEAYEVEFVRRDSLASGSLELSVRRSDSARSLRLGAARIVP